MKINYQECFHYYRKLLLVCDEHCTHGIVQWYQTKCRIYLDEHEYPPSKFLWEM
jgi:hypothetical protein